MLFKLPLFLRLPLAALSVLINTLAHTTPLFFFAFLKWLVPVKGFRRFCDGILIGLAESWIARNSDLIALFTPTRIEIEGLEGLDRQGHYLVLANHQSWVDIPVLQHALNRRIPFLRFFLKSQLIWVPVLGLAWWALDFPFMKRYTKSELARNPALAGKDMEATRKACEKFRGLPVSIMNFVEGTRFTAAKHARQKSPYRHLLKPRAGGMAMALATMGEDFQALLDVTIAYPGGTPTFWDLLCGRMGAVVVRVEQRPIPTALVGVSDVGDPQFRAGVQEWLAGMWNDKDRRLGELLSRDR